MIKRLLDWMLDQSEQTRDVSPPAERGGADDVRLAADATREAADIGARATREAAEINAQAAREAAQIGAGGTRDAARIAGRTALVVAAIGLVGALGAAWILRATSSTTVQEALEQELDASEGLRFLPYDALEQALGDGAPYQRSEPSLRARQLADSVPGDASPYGRALRAIAVGDHAGALQLLDATGFGHATSFEIARARGWALAFAGRHREAVAEFERAHQLRPTDLAIAWQKAVAQFNVADYEEARASFDRIEGQLRDAGAVRSLEFAQILENQARLSRALGDYDRADSLYVLVDGVRRRLLDQSDPVLIRTRLGRAALLVEAQRYLQADSILDGLSSVRLQPDLIGAELLLVRGYPRYYQADYDSAKVLWDGALQLARSTLPYDHPGTATVYDALGNWYHDRQFWDLAEANYKEALYRWTSALGAEHPTTTLAMNNLAELYRAKVQAGAGDSVATEAERLYTQALQLRLAALGEHHPWVLISRWNFAAYWEVRGSFDQAATLLAEAIDIAERTYGADYPDLAYMYNNLAEINRNRGNFDVDSLYVRSLELFRGVLGDQHPNIAIVTYNRARTLTEAGEHLESVPHLMSAIDMMEAFQADYRLLPDWYDLLIANLEELGRSDEAGAWRRRRHAGAP